MTRVLFKCNCWAPACKIFQKLQMTIVWVLGGSLDLGCPGLCDGGFARLKGCGFERFVSHCLHRIARASDIKAAEDV